MSHFEIFVTYNTHTLEPQNIVNSFTKIAVKCRTHFRYLQKMLTSKPSTLRRFWAPIYRSVLSEILGPRDPAILQRRHFVPLKPVITRNPQTRKPANPQTRKPANPQTRKPANPQTRKPANPQTRKPANPQTRKPVNPQTRKPANPQTRKPANPQTRKPANPQTRKPANPQTRKPANPH